MRLTIILTLISLLSLNACAQQAKNSDPSSAKDVSSVQNSLPNYVQEALKKEPLTKNVTKTEAEWKKELTEAEYYVLREDGTETPFRNEYNNNKKEGIYYCAACHNPMFTSHTKFDSGTGWPSFYAPISKERINEVEDRSLGMLRIEVECARCGSHIGHVFDDGPEPTGLRYCLNSVALDFEKKD